MISLKIAWYLHVISSDRDRSASVFTAALQSDIAALAHRGDIQMSWIAYFGICCFSSLPAHNTVLSLNKDLNSVWQPRELRLQMSPARHTDVKRQTVCSLLKTTTCILRKTIITSHRICPFYARCVFYLSLNYEK